MLGRCIEGASQLKNVLLFLVSIAFSVLVAEALVRYIDGYAMFAMPLSDPTDSVTVSPQLLEAIPVAAGVERQWFYSEPPPLANRKPVPADWQKLFRHIEDNPSGGMEFRPPDVFKAWNSVFAGDPCRHKFLRHAPSQLWLYDPPDGAASPSYGYGTRTCSMPGYNSEWTGVRADPAT